MHTATFRFPTLSSCISEIRPFLSEIIVQDDVRVTPCGRIGFFIASGTSNIFLVHELPARQLYRIVDLKPLTDLSRLDDFDADDVSTTVIDAEMFLIFDCDASALSPQTLFDGLANLLRARRATRCETTSETVPVPTTPETAAFCSLMERLYGKSNIWNSL